MHEELAYLSKVTHQNQNKVTPAFYDLIQKILVEEIKVNLLCDEFLVEEHKKTYFLLIFLLFLTDDINSVENQQHIKKYCKFMGKQFITVLLIDLLLIKEAIYNPRNIQAKKFNQVQIKFMMVNLVKSIAYLEKLEINTGVLEQFLKTVLVQNETNEIKTITFVVNDLIPQQHNTLTKLLFDLIKVFLEKTNYQLKIISCKLHAPQHQFWLPSIAQSRKINLDTFLNMYQMDSNERLELIYLNERYYENNDTKIATDVVITYPFKYVQVEKYLYNFLPVIEIELVSSMSKAKYCDIVIPNGIPSDIFLQKHFHKTVLTFFPRVSFNIKNTVKIDYLSSAYTWIATVAKDFDLRPGFKAEVFFTAVEKLLQHNSKLAWTFIGSSSRLADYLANNFPDLLATKRIVLREYEYDLPSLMQCLAFYVHPPIMGGGRSPSIAIEYNCVALVFNFGDCIKYVPYELQFESIEKITHKIVELHKNPAMYTKFMQIGKRIFAGSVNDEAMLNFELAIQRARCKFLIRTKAITFTEAES